MRLLLEQNVSVLVAEGLRQSGHDVVHTRDYSMQRAKDPEVVERAVDENRIIVTKDHDDFSILLAHSKATSPSLINLRLPVSEWQPSRQGEIISTVIFRYQDELERGAILTVRHLDDVRVRLLPLSN